MGLAAGLSFRLIRYRLWQNCQQMAERPTKEKVRYVLNSRLSFVVLVGRVGLEPTTKRPNPRLTDTRTT